MHGTSADSKQGAGDPLGLDGGKNEHSVEDQGGSTWDRSVEHMIKATRDGLNGVLLLMSKTADPKARRMFGTIASFVIDTFQMLAFVVNAHAGNSALLVDFFSFFNFHTWFTDSFGYVTTLVVAIAVVFIELANALYVGYSWTQGEFHSIWSVKFLRNTSLLLVGILFIPIISVFASLLNCASIFPEDFGGGTPNPNIATLPSADSPGDTVCLVGGPIVAVLSMLLISLSLVVAASFHDASPTSANSSARPHSRLEMATLFVNTITSILAAIVLTDQPKAPLLILLWQLVLLVCYSYLSFLYIWYQPYYALTISKFRAGLILLVAWASFLQLVRLGVEELHGDPRGKFYAYDHVPTAVPTALALPASDSPTPSAAPVSLSVTPVFDPNAQLLDEYAQAWTSSYTMFGSLALTLSSLLMFPVASMLIDARLANVRKKSYSMCRNEFEFELKVRDDMRAITANVRSNRDPDGTIDGHSLQHLTPEQKQEIAEIRKAYTDACRHFDNSSLICMFMAEFMCSYMAAKDAVVPVRRAIIEASIRKPSFDVSFSIVRKKSQLKTHLSDGQDIMAYVMGEKYEREASEADQKCCILLARFWDALNEKNPNFDMARRMAGRIGDTTAQAKNAYRRLTQLQPHNADVLRRHANFLEEVCNQEADAQRLISRAEFIERGVGDNTRGKDHGSGLSDGVGDGKLNDNAGVIVFDAQGIHHHFGEILTTNQKAGEILNELSSRLVGKEITSFMIPPFSNGLRTIMEEYFNTGESDLINTPLTTFLIGQDCVEVRLRLIPFTSNGMDYDMYANFSTVRSTSQCYFVCTEDGNIVAMDTECFDTLSAFSSAPVPTRNIDVDELLQGDFDPKNPDLLKLPGVSYDIKHPQPDLLPVKLTGADTPPKKHVTLFVEKIKTPASCTPMYKVFVTGEPLFFQERRRRTSVLLPMSDDMSDEGGSGGGDSVQDEFGNDFAEAINPHKPDDFGMSVEEEDEEDDSVGSDGGSTKAFRGEEEELLLPPALPRSQSHRTGMSGDGDTAAKQKPDSKDNTDKKQSTAVVTAPHDDGGNLASAAKAPRGAQLGSPSFKRSLRHLAGNQRTSSAEDSRSRMSDSTHDSAATSMVNTLRVKLTHQNRMTSLHPRLARLRKYYLFTVLLLMLLVGATYAVTMLAFDSYLNENKVNSAGLRRFMLSDIEYRTFQLFLLSKGITLPLGDPEQAIRDELYESASRLHSLDLTLFERRHTYHDELRNLYEHPSTDILRINERGAVFTERRAVFDAVSFVASLAQQAAVTPLDELAADDAMVFSLLHNNFNPRTGRGLLDMLMETTLIYSQSVRGVVYRVMYVVEGCSIVSFAIVLSVLLFVVIPTTRGVQRHKGEVFEVFAAIPGPSIKKVTLRYQSRLSRVHGIVSDMHETVQVKKKKSNKTSKKRKSRGHRKDSDGSANEKRSILWRIVPRALGGGRSRAVSDVARAKAKIKGESSATEKKALHDHARKGSAVHLSKLLAILVLSLIFFVCFVEFVIILIAPILLDAPGTADYGGQHAMRARNAMHKLNMAIAGYEREHVGFDLERIGRTEVDAEVDELEFLHESVIYGNDERKITGLLELAQGRVDPRVELFYTNGCLGYSQPPELELCKEVSNGIFNKGLSPAIFSFASKVRAFGVANLADVVEDDDSNNVTELDGFRLRNSLEFINETMASPTLDELVYLERNYMQQQLTRAVVIGEEEIEGIAYNALRLGRDTALIFLLVLPTVYFSLVRPTIKRLDSELKGTRSLLLLIPEDVLENLPELRKFLLTEFKEHSA